MSISLTVKMELTLNVEVEYGPTYSHPGDVEVLAVYIRKGAQAVEIGGVLSPEDTKAIEQYCAEDLEERRMEERAEKAARLRQEDY